MSSKTKIYVIKSKELIYTAFFVVIALILIILMVCMFLPKKDNQQASTDTLPTTPTPTQSNTDYTIPSLPNDTSASYTPGIYSTDIMLGGYYVNLSLTIDKDRIKSVELHNLTDAITTMYPLIEPAMEDIKNELLNTGGIKKLDYSDDNQYTYSILSDAINNLIDLASK